MKLKEDILSCSFSELSFGLCQFIQEVRRPNGEKYDPDSILYLCLGIQQVTVFPQGPLADGVLLAGCWLGCGQHMGVFLVPR